jgi:alpha-glucosidase (family GH31 glycosyl hydrolase)
VDGKRAEGYPCDGLVLDGPWRGGPEFLLKYMSDGEYPTNNLNWHPDFGDGTGMVRRLGEAGYKVVLHQNSRSWLSDTVEKGLADGTIRRHGRETVVTFGTEAGEEFYHDAIRPRHREGVALWWLDHGDRVGGELLPGIPSRNTFGALWALVTQRCAEADGGGKQICLIRGAGIGGQRASLPWPGDTQFGIDFFLNDLRFCMSAGLSGFPVTSADLGGFMPVRIKAALHNTAFDEDNLARRLCHAMMVIPSPRMHQCDTDPPKFPWNCPPHIQPLYRRMIEERYRLTPYYFSYAVRAARTGDPIVRPLVYAYQDDPETISIEDQCLIGDWFMAAPVFTKGATSRSVYLPRGTAWYNWWTDERVEGGQRIDVDAPLCEPRGLPLYIRAGAIAPSQELTQYLTDELPPIITVDLWPTAESSWIMEEGEGKTTEFVCRKTDRVELKIVNRTGRPRRFKIRCHGVGNAMPLCVNGRDLGRVGGGLAEIEIA